MPPYMRFPETEAIQQKIWGFCPRNPTCGLVSLETGTKFYASTNFVFGVFGTLASIVLLMMIISTYSSQPTHHEILQGLVQSAKNGEQPDDWLHKMHFKQKYAVIIVALLMTLTFCILWSSLFWKLKKAIVERNVPTLKKYFVILFLFEILFVLFWDVESEVNWTYAFLVDVPFTVFEIMGLIFTYSFISSLVNPDSSQHDDLNRIQFSV